MPVAHIGVCPSVFDEVKDPYVVDEPRHLTMLLLEAQQQARESYGRCWDFVERPGRYTTMVERMYAGLREFGDGLVAQGGAPGTGFWCLLAVVAGEQACFGARSFDGFPEGSGLVLGDAGAGVDALIPGCQSGETFGLLHFGRDAGHRPTATVFSLARRTQMTGLRLPDRANWEPWEVKGFPWLDRLDGWPTLKALWLGDGQGALLLVTGDPAADLARLRRWGPGATPDDLESSLLRQAWELAAQGRMTWYLAHNQGRSVSLRQICLQNRFERRSLLPSLAGDGSGEGQRQTRAAPVRLHQALVRVDGDRLVFDTFVWDAVRQESPLGYRAQDYRGCPRHRLRVDQTDFDVWVPDPDVHRPWVEEPTRFGPDSSRLQFTIPSFSEEQLSQFKYVRTSRYSWLKTPQTEDLGNPDVELEEKARHQMVETIAEACYKSTLLSEEESHEIHKTAWLDPETGTLHIPRVHGPRLLTDGALADRLCRDARRTDAPGIRHERLFLHLAFPMRIGDGALTQVREGVLSIRVPLEVAWHGVDLSGLFGTGGELFLAVCDTGLVLRVGQADGSVFVCRPDLEEVLQLEGVLTPRLGRLVGDWGVATTDPQAPVPVCEPGSVARLVLSGHPALGKLGQSLQVSCDDEQP